MQSFPFDSRVTYQSDGTPVYDRAINSEVYRGLLSNLFTTGILSSKADNMQVTSNNDMTVNVLSGFAMVQGVMNLNKETVTLDVETADTNYSRIDTVVLRLNTNDDFRNCEFHIVKGVASEVPVRPALTREIAIYEIGLADITVAAGTTSITEANIIDTRYEDERCGVITTGDISKYIHDIQSAIDEINKNMTANDSHSTKFNFDYKDGQYGYYKPGQEFSPFGGEAYLYRYGKKTQLKELVLEPVHEWEATSSSLPYGFNSGSAVVDANGEINLLGGYNSKNHYVNVDGVWSSKSTLPTEFYNGDAVVDKDKHINIIGGNYSSSAYYKYVDGSWSYRQDLPYAFIYGSALLDKDGNINIIGSNRNTTNHYKLVNGVWSSVSTLPYGFYEGEAVLDVNKDINILGTGGSSSDRKKHYKYHNGAWVSVSTLPVDFYNSAAVLDVDTIVIMNGYNNNRLQYAFVDGEWQRVDTLPYGFYDGSALIDSNGEINLLGGQQSQTDKYHYKYHQTGLKVHR